MSKLVYQRIKADRLLNKKEMEKTLKQLKFQMEDEDFYKKVHDVIKEVAYANHVNYGKVTEDMIIKYCIENRKLEFMQEFQDYFKEEKL